MELCTKLGLDVRVVITNFSDSDESLIYVVIKKRTSSPNDL